MAFRIAMIATKLADRMVTAPFRAADFFILTFIAERLSEQRRCQLKNVVDSAI
jgi:hypothetical protein